MTDNDAQARSNDPLAGLDDIDWAGLQHAYGSAADVPGQLRQLRSDDAEQRSKARGELYGNIFHQGSRYEASAHAVPFLFALVTEADTPDRDEIVSLLTAIAIGHDESYLPVGVNPVLWRGEVERLRQADPDEIARGYDKWVAEAPDDAERQAREAQRALFDLEEQQQHADSELAAYDAVRQHVPKLCTLLEDDDSAVRVAAAYALAWFPEERGQAMPALRARLDAESVPTVLATAIVALGLLLDTTSVPVFTEQLAGSKPLPRWAAATALACLDVTESAVISELVAVSAEPPEHADPPIAYLGGDLRGFSSLSLARLGKRVPDEALDGVLDGLSRSSQVHAFPVAAAALQMTFGEPDGHPLPSYSELTETQQRTVRTLADLDQDTWQWVNFTNILRAWQLPADRAECRRYAELD